MPEAISLQQLKEILYSKESFVILDVRSLEEYKELRIVGTLHMPINSLHETYTSLPPHKKLVTHCAHGFRAKKAAIFLESTLHCPVFYVLGDIEDWKESGLPLAFEK